LYFKEYNRGVFDYLIATDASVDRGEENEKEDNSEAEDDSNGSNAKPTKDRNGKGKNRAKQEDVEYGVSRGIDFHGVNFVINFDFPLTSAAYTHRIGRTARGNATGTALSFVTKLESIHVSNLVIH